MPVLHLSNHPIAHDAGGPPHRPHIGTSDEELLPAVCAPTANTLNARAVFVDPHFGHATFSVELIDFTSFSNFSSQALQSYS
jgi:hypothetical protein